MKYFTIESAVLNVMGCWAVKMKEIVFLLGLATDAWYDRLQMKDFFTAG